MKTKKTLVALPTVLAIVLMIGTGCGSAKKTTKGLDASSTPGDSASRDDRGAVPDKSDDTMSSFSLNDIYFDFDRYDLRTQDRETLVRNAEWLSSNPSARVIIEGHCDERGTVEYNLALGEKRARTAKAFLESYGISSSRLEVVSYGKERPLDHGHNESAWAKNRRDSFVKR